MFSPSAATSEDCTQGFISRDILTSVELKEALDFTQSSLFLVVPELTFITSGLLRKWSFVAEKTFSVQTEYPKFQVWRRDGQVFTAVSGTSTPSSAPSLSGYLNVYEYILDPPVPVEAGDFVGMEVPERIEAQLRFSMVRGVGYDIHQVTFKFDDEIRSTLVLTSQFIPLLNVELLGKPYWNTSVCIHCKLSLTLCVFCVCIPSVNELSETNTSVSSVSRSSVTASSLTPALSLSVATDTLQSTSTPLPTPSPTTTATLGSDSTVETGQVGPIVGGVVAAVVICVLILAIVLLSVLLIYKKRNKKYSHKSEHSPADSDLERDWENPVYSSKEPLYSYMQSLTPSPCPPAVPAKNTNTAGRGSTPQSKNGNISSEMLTLSRSSIPVLQKQDSGEYAEPIDHIRSVEPPTSPSPRGSPQSSPSPTTSSPPYYRILESSNASPRVSPRSSPLLPARNLQTSPCLSPFASLDRQRLGPHSPGPRHLHSPSPPSPYASLDRQWMMHSRETSTVSDSDASHPVHLWEVAGHPFRVPSKGSSLSGDPSRSPSQGKGYDEEEGHVYHTLEPQGVSGTVIMQYNMHCIFLILLAGIFQTVPKRDSCSHGGEGRDRTREIAVDIQHFICTQEQRKRATSTSRERRIDIYAALSEVSIIVECIHITVLVTSSLRLYAVLLSIHA